MNFPDVDEEGRPIRWQRRAKCLGVDPDLFFPDNTGGAQTAKTICNGTYDGDKRCTVVKEDGTFCGGHLKRVSDDTLRCTAKDCGYGEYSVRDAVCPVCQECLDYAVAAHEWTGIWGAKTERERRVYVRIRRGVKVADS